ncbi:MAG: universal stress protein [Myxococcota bacterium]
MKPVWIVAYDFSSFSDAAARQAADDARAFGARLHLLHALNSEMLHEEQDWEIGASAGVTWHDYLSQARATASGALTAARAALREDHPDVEVSVEVVDGHPVDALVKAGDRPEVDRIVMGSHGRKGLRRWMLGSVAEQVVRRAHVPVLVVKHAEPPQAE